MSSVLAREVNAVQNSALAAVLLWRFCVGYSTARKTPATTPLPALFVLLPVLFNEETNVLLGSTLTKSGLRLFAGKFNDSVEAKADILLSLERHAIALRHQTLAAFKLALSTRLLFLDPATAEVVALSEAAPKSLPESLRPLMRNAEKLGAFSGAVSLFELGSVLHMGF